MSSSQPSVGGAHPGQGLFCHPFRRNRDTQQFGDCDMLRFVIMCAFATAFVSGGTSSATAVCQLVKATYRPLQSPKLSKARWRMRLSLKPGQH